MVVYFLPPDDRPHPSQIQRMIRPWLARKHTVICHSYVYSLKVPDFEVLRRCDALVLGDIHTVKHPLYDEANRLKIPVFVPSDPIPHG